MHVSYFSANLRASRRKLAVFAGVSLFLIFLSRFRRSGLVQERVGNFSSIEMEHEHVTRHGDHYFHVGRVKIEGHGRDFQLAPGYYWLKLEAGMRGYHEGLIHQELRKVRHLVPGFCLSVAEGQVVMDKYANDPVTDIYSYILTPDAGTRLDVGMVNAPSPITTSKWLDSLCDIVQSFINLHADPTDTVPRFRNIDTGKNNLFISSEGVKSTDFGSARLDYVKDARILSLVPHETYRRGAYPNGNTPMVRLLRGTEYGLQQYQFSDDKERARSIDLKDLLHKLADCPASWEEVMHELRRLRKSWAS